MDCENNRIFIGISALSVAIYDVANKIIPIEVFTWSGKKMFYTKFMRYFNFKISDIFTTNRKPSISYHWTVIEKRFIFTRKNWNSIAALLHLLWFGSKFSFPSNFKIYKGNHELFMRRRKPDPVDIQQMRLQATKQLASGRHNSLVSSREFMFWLWNFRKELEKEIQKRKRRDREIRKLRQQIKVFKWITNFE